MMVLEMHRMSGLEKGHHSLEVITQFPDAKARPKLGERMPVGFQNASFRVFLQSNNGR